MQLIKAFRYTLPTSVAFVGAGGKTTAIFKAARELLKVTREDQKANTILVTTTTHIGAWQAEQADHFQIINSHSDITKFNKDLPGGVVLLTGNKNNNLLSGLPSRLLEIVRVFAEEHQYPLLIEADGSRSCPLKAPADHEPAIPNFTQCVVVVAGLQGLGKPLTNNWVHRPVKYAALSGLQPGEEITAYALGKVLLDKGGGLKNIPPNARRIALLNQADTPELQAAAKTISEMLIPDYHSVIVATLSGESTRLAVIGARRTESTAEIHVVNEQIAGIILAAGESSRFGEPKQLLLWKGEPLIWHVAKSALSAGLSPVIVVVGSSAAEIASVINDLPLRIVTNSIWNTGLSSSIKAGVAALPMGVGGVVFLQADQPQIPPTLIKRLIEAHNTTLNTIVAPQIDDQRGNPVLFDACTFTKLLALEGEVGGRMLFGQFQVQWVTWHDSKLLMDIDSPGDYRNFLEKF